MFAALCLLLAAPFSEDPGLIANGGFEELQGERPARWDLFVAPPPETWAAEELPSARVSQGARAGSYCVSLGTRTPYPREPYNNWSQNLFGEFHGKRLRLQAAIRTENADGAAVWVQCWKRQPLQVLHVANTSIEQPMLGTNDWTEVATEFDVPDGTDFLMVRCVLKGAGTAWFDEVQLRETQKPEPEPPAPPTVAEERPVESSPAAAPEPEPEPASPPAPEAAPVLAEAAAIEAELARLKEANVLLAEALDSMQGERAGMIEELMALQTQMKLLQEALPAARKREAPVARGGKMPPLVPMDYPEAAP